MKPGTTSAYDRQIEGGSAVANTAAVFYGDNVQAEVEARFDAPIPAVGSKQLLGTQLGGRAGTDQVFGFDALATGSDPSQRPSRTE